MELLLKNVRLIKKESTDLQDILIENKFIKKIGKNLNSRNSIVLECNSDYVLPAFINLHLHLSYYFSKAIPKNFRLFLYRMLIEDKLLENNPNMKKKAFENTIRASFKFGVAGFISMDCLSPEIIEGIVTLIGKSGAYFIFTPVFYKNRNIKNKILAYSNYLEKNKDKNESQNNVRFGIGPHSFYAIEEDDLFQLSRISAKFNLPVSMHVAEWRNEKEILRKKYNKSFRELIDYFNLGNENLISVHNLYMDREDLFFLKKCKAGIVLNPTANKILHKKMPSIQNLKDYDKLGIGTDNPFYSLNIYKEIMDFFEPNNLFEFQDILKKSYNVFNLPNAGEVIPGNLAILQIVDKKKFSEPRNEYSVKHLIINGELKVRDYILQV
jgi:5-methylthioadenosine/S-adenosylhomocysteine deaminase